MNRLSVILLVVFAFLPLFLNAQEDEEMKTLFGGDREFRFGGYGALEIKGSQLDGGFHGFLVGGRGGMIINNAFVFGGAGYGIIPTRKVDCPMPNHDNNHHLTGGYGGLFFEYLHQPNRLLHFTANMLVGAGGVTLADMKNAGNVNTDNSDKHSGAFVFVLEPGLAWDLNVSEFLRMSLGVSYRYSPNFRLQYEAKYIVPNTAFNGFSVNLTFKFGNFRRQYTASELNRMYAPPPVVVPPVVVPQPVIVR